MPSIGLDASLAILRQELEGMQKQDKALYSQLLTLRESIRGLKTELKKEREEALKDLEEISATEFEDDVFVEGIVPWENEKNENALSVQDTWKHDRQDSGISVKTPEAESLESCPSHQCFKPELISHGKQDLNPHFKTIHVELPQKKISNTKPVLIQHSKQDSGILIDEDAVRETKLLSKLVESSEMLENRKIDRIIQKKWNKVRDNSPANIASQIHHQRSRSNNDLLKFPPQRGLLHQYSTPDLQTLYSHNSSCPQIKLLTAQGTEVNIDNLSSQQLNERNRLIPSHLRTSSCPQSTLKLIRASTKRPNELVKAKRLESVERQQSKPPDEVKKSREDESPNRSHSSTPSDRTSLSLALNPGSDRYNSKSVFQQNFIPRHEHTRSLPATPIREFGVSRQENRGSAENISDYKTMTSKQVRPRKRSASFVDLDSLKESDGVRSSFEPFKAKSVDDSSLQQANVTGESSPATKSFAVHQTNVIEKDDVKRTRENDNTRTARKANVVQVDSFSDQTRNSSDDLTREHESTSNKSLTSYKANVVRVNSLPQGAGLMANKAKVVHINSPKQPQENITQSNSLAEASKPLRAVLVSAAEVNVSSVLTDIHTLSRKCSLDERGIGNFRPDGHQRKLAITSYKTERISPRSPPEENGVFSSRLLAPRNHIRHHTMPEYDAIRRRHSFYTIHAPSKSWDGCTKQKSTEFNRMVRSVSQVSFV